MRFGIATVVLAALSAAVAKTVTVSYDSVYDTKSLSTANIACSDGKNGLRTKGYKHIGDLPTWPYVGGSYYVGGWNSTACGTCYVLSYKGRNITVTAIDHTDHGFNLAKAALDKLTNGKAKQLGRVNATLVQVAEKFCGLKAGVYED